MLLTTWPNWVDLVIVTVVIRACYSGYAAGFLLEILRLAGAVTLTVLTVNYWRLGADALQSSLALRPDIANLTVFWVLFATLFLALRVLLRRVNVLLNWKRMHWTQGVSFVLGGLRGSWWVGFLMILMTSSGFVYLRESVTVRSVLGPKLVTIARTGLERVADQFPGAKHRADSVVPAWRGGQSSR